MVTKKVLQIILVQVREGYMSVDDATEVIMECVDYKPYITFGDGKPFAVPCDFGRVTVGDTITMPNSGGLELDDKASRP